MKSARPIDENIGYKNTTLSVNTIQSYMTNYYALCGKYIQKNM